MCFLDSFHVLSNTSSVCSQIPSKIQVIVNTEQYIFYSLVVISNPDCFLTKATDNIFAPSKMVTLWNKLIFMLCPFLSSHPLPVHKVLSWVCVSH